MQLLLLLSLILSTLSITFDRGSSDSSESCDDTSEYYPRPHRPRPHRPRPPPHRPRPPPAERTKCPDTWMLFRRPQGNWCVTLFHKSQTWQGADNMCKTYGGLLTGLQTRQERMRLAEAARRIVQPLTPRNASVWIGAKRKPECPRRGVCQDQNSFYWTDGHTTGTAGFQWTASQPDGLVEGHYGVQSCARMAVFSGGSAASPRHGAYDDWTCQYLPSRVTLVASKFCNNLTTSKIPPSTTTLTTTKPSSTTKEKHLIKTSHMITVGAICGILLLFIIGIIIFCFIRRRRQRKKEEAEGWGIHGWSSTSTASESSTKSHAKSDSESGAWDFGTSMDTAKEKTNMMTAMGGGATGASKKNKKEKKDTKKKSASKPTGAPVTPSTPATTPTAGTPSAPAAAPKSGFAGLPAVLGGAAKKSQMAQKAPKSASNEKHESTGNTATIRPLIWNKQAAGNVYY